MCSFGNSYAKHFGQHFFFSKMCSINKLRDFNNDLEVFVFMSPSMCLLKKQRALKYNVRTDNPSAGKTGETQASTNLCSFFFYLTMHARHDPIHIEEYRFVFASKYSLL